VLQVRRTYLLTKNSRNQLTASALGRPAELKFVLRTKKKGTPMKECLSSLWDRLRM